MKNKPTHYLSVVSGDGDQARFTEVAALWPTKNGNGFSGQIREGISITGRIVIMPAKARDEQDGGAQ